MAISHRITISLTQTQSDEITRIASAHGFSKSEAVRAILEQFLTNNEAKLNFNPKTSLRGRNHTRNHPGDVKSNPRSDSLIAAFKDAEEFSASLKAAVADEQANGSRTVSKTTSKKMEGFLEEPSHIVKITRLIDDIAFQTNLLALNAAVEAARASEAGSGFSTVATEVRALASKSAEAAKSISDLIAESTIQVESGMAIPARLPKSSK